jgi:hypothetical protein
MERPVLEISHDKADGDAFLRNTELSRYRVNHRARHINGSRNFSSPDAFILFDVVEQSNAHGECAFFLHDTRVQAREPEIGSAVEEIHWFAPAKPKRAETYPGFTAAHIGTAGLAYTP